MLEIGNLAIVCAQKKDVSFQIYEGTVTVHLGRGSNHKSLTTHWTDNEKIKEFVYELNHGRFKDV